MGRETKSYTSLPEANTDKIRTYLVLPFSLERQIGLDVKAIQSLMQLGGIAQLAIKNAPTNGNSNRRMPVPVDINSGGVATGRITWTTTNIKTSENNVEKIEGNLHNSKWADLTILLNTQNISQKILEKNRVITDPEPWKKELKSALKRGLLQASYQQLIKMDADDKFTAVLSYGLMISLNNIYSFTQKQEPEYLKTLLFYSFFANIFTQYDAFRRGYENGARLSILPYGPEFDRFLVTSVAILSKSLVGKVEKVTN